MKISKYRLRRLIRNIAVALSLICFLAWAWFGAGDGVLLAGQVGMVVCILITWFNRSKYEVL